jgi:hypothetical protein
VHPPVGPRWPDAGVLHVTGWRPEAPLARMHATPEIRSAESWKICKASQAFRWMGAL